MPDYAAAFQAIGPAAVKLGQTLATRPDLVGITCWQVYEAQKGGQHEAAAAALLACAEAGNEPSMILLSHAYENGQGFAQSDAKATFWVKQAALRGYAPAQLHYARALMAGTALIAVLRCMGSGVREGWWGLGFLGAFAVLSLSESVLLTHANLPWVLMLAILARAVTFDPVPVRPPLARPASRAYQNRPRIASDYVNGRRSLRF